MESEQGEYRYHIGFSNTTPVFELDSTQVFFDETIHEVVSSQLESNKVTRCPIGGKPKSYELIQGAKIEEIKFSPGNPQFVGVHRAGTCCVEVTSLVTNKTLIIQPTQREKSNFLGYNWSNPTSLFIVTSTGVEFFSIIDWQVRLIRDYSFPINWFVYSAPLRVLICSTGPRTSILQAFHFSISKKIFVRLPKFDLSPKKDVRPISKQEIVIAQIYSGLFCIHISKKHKELILHHLTEESVIPKLTIDTHLDTGDVSISIVDDLIITHSVDHQVTMIFDIKLRTLNERRIQFPICAPLPITPYYFVNDEKKSMADIYKGWQFHLPDVVVSKTTGLGWNIELNLAAICATISDRVKLINFLIHREGSKPLLINALKSALLEKESLSVLTSIFDIFAKAMHKVYVELEKKPQQEDENTQRKTSYFWNTFMHQGVPEKIDIPAERFHDNSQQVQPQDESQIEVDYLTQDFIIVNKPNKKVSIESKQGKKKGKEIIFINQEEFYSQVLLPVEETHAVGHKYLISVAIEFIRCLNFQYIYVGAFLYEFVIDLLVRNDHLYQLHQFLQYHVINDSFHVACQLLSLESKYQPCYQLALDMLKRLGRQDQIVEVLISKGQAIQALNFIKVMAQKGQKITINVEQLFECALQNSDPNIFYSVYEYIKNSNTLSKTEAKTIALYKQKFLEKYQEIEKKGLGHI